MAAINSSTRPMAESVWGAEIAGQILHTLTSLRAIGCTFVRRSEWVPNCKGSRPMPASHSESTRAYWRVVRGPSDFRPAKKSLVVRRRPNGTTPHKRDQYVAN